MTRKLSKTKIWLIGAISLLVASALVITINQQLGGALFDNFWLFLLVYTAMYVVFSYSIACFMFRLNEQGTIEDCIKRLEQGEPWYNNELSIVITKDLLSSNRLIVRNDPLWIYKFKKFKNDTCEAQLQRLINDFETLQRSSAWKKYIRGKVIAFNLYSDETTEDVIEQTTDKTY